MKESIGESWTIQLIAAFVLLFVAFLSLMIAYSRCFKVKNEVVSIIEKYETLEKSKSIISNYMNAAGYTGTGTCRENSEGGITYVKTLCLENNGEFALVTGNRTGCRACIEQQDDNNNHVTVYRVSLFYNFNIPAFGKLATFEVTGKTIDLKYVKQIGV